MPRLAPLASCLALAASFAGAQEPVVVDAVVTAKSGIVKNLTAKDFKVWDDNKEQTVTAAPLRGPGKHAVVLLFDSTSLSAAKQGDIRGYVASFIDAAANPNLYMEVAVFRTGIQILRWAKHPKPKPVPRRPCPAKPVASPISWSRISPAWTAPR